MLFLDERQYGIRFEWHCLFRHRGVYLHFLLSIVFASHSGDDELYELNDKRSFPVCCSILVSGVGRSM